MKKLLVVLLTLALCVTTLASCDFVTNLFGDKQEEVAYDVEAAANYVYNLYKNKDVTAADFEVTAVAAIAGVKHTVEWSVNTDKVSITKKNDTTYIVNVDEESAEELKYALTATIKGGDKTATKTFNLTVPKYVLTSFEDYMAAKEGDNVVVKGIVVAINSKSAGNKYNHLFLADLNGKGGYYCYSMAKDPIADDGIELGMTVEVSGSVTPYSGMQEIKGGTARIVDSNKKNVEVLDITTKVANGENLANYVGLPVTVKGVEIKGQELDKDTSQYLKFELNGVSSYVRTYVTDFPTTLPVDKKGEIDAAHNEHFGWRANATGILVLYSGAPYLIPMGTDCFEYIELIVKTNEEKIADSLANLTLETLFTADTEVTLPTKGAYDEVALTWATSDATNAAIANGKLTVKLSDKIVEATITVTATCGDKTDTKEFKIKINSKKIPGTIAGPALAPVAPVAGTAYKLGFIQGNLGKAYYLTGAMDGYYMASTETFADAIDYFVEATDGGYYLYCMVDGAKKYVNFVVDGTYVNGKYEDTAATVYTYNETLKTLVAKVNDTDYILGTRNDKTFATLGPVKASNNPFYAQLVTEAAKDVLVMDSTTPVVETPYKLGFVQGNKNNAYFLTGAMDGYYFASTDVLTNGVNFYIEATDGGYYLYFMVDGAKKYVNFVVDGTYVNGKFEDTATTVYTYSETLKTLVAVVNDTDYILGTRNDKTFTTLGPVKASNNPFYAQFVVAPATEEEEEGGNTDTTLVAPAAGKYTYKFADYEAGTQYAANEVHKLDNSVVVTTNDAHFTTQIRLYKNAAGDNYEARNGTAVFQTGGAVKGLSINAGGKKNPIEVYGSTNGTDWVLIATIEVPSETYTDYTVTLNSTSYTYIKLAAKTAQARIASVTFEF